MTQQITLDTTIKDLFLLAAKEKSVITRLGIGSELKLYAIIGADKIEEIEEVISEMEIRWELRKVTG